MPVLQYAEICETSAFGTACVECWLAFRQTLQLPFLKRLCIGYNQVVTAVFTKTSDIVNIRRDLCPKAGVLYWNPAAET
jgi:hypothetical protein